MPIQKLRRVAGRALFGLKKVSVLSLFTVEEFVVVLIPLALVGMYWLWEASK